MSEASVTPWVPNMDDYVDRWLVQNASNVIYLIEATSFEISTLYTRYKDTWKDVTHGGPMVTVGHINGRPIVVMMTIHNIEGSDFLFYEATSQLVDFVMVEDWFKTKFPHLFAPDDVHQRCDANNFHNAAHKAIRIREKAGETK